MKNKELFEKTVKVLVNAYLNGTLQNASCSACAVGNLLLASNGLTPITTESGELRWPLDDIDYTYNDVSWFDVLNKGKEPNDRINGLNKTGYSWLELGLIEKAFEKSKVIENDRMFSNMMSVVDCLMQIHEATEDEVKEAKSMFIKETA